MSTYETSDMYIHQQKLDTILNKTFLDLVVFSGMGYVAGIGASIFFRHRLPIKSVAAGLGGSFAFVNNRRHFNALK